MTDMEKAQVLAAAARAVQATRQAYRRALKDLREALAEVQKEQA